MELRAGWALGDVTDGPEGALEGYAAIKDLKKKKKKATLPSISDLTEEFSVPGRLIFSVRRVIFNGSVEHAILMQVFL